MVLRHPEEQHITPENLGGAVATGLQQYHQTRKLKAEADSSEALAKMNKLDADYFKDKPNISPMSLKHTPTNLAGSEAYGMVRDEFLTALDFLMNPIDGVTSLFDKVKNVTKDPEHRSTAKDVVEKLKKLGKAHPILKFLYD